MSLVELKQSGHDGVLVDGVGGTVVGLDRFPNHVRRVCASRQSIGVSKIGQLVIEKPCAISGTK